jgi:hypothetical protein
MTGTIRAEAGIKVNLRAGNYNMVDKLQTAMHSKIALHWRTDSAVQNRTVLLGLFSRRTLCAANRI